MGLFSVIIMIVMDGSGRCRLLGLVVLGGRVDRVCRLISGC